MSKTLQLRRYDALTLAGITGAAGEIIVNTDTNTLTVHDGLTPGGTALLNENSNSALIGDVSIVGNTISALDSYGLPNVLDVSGTLTINGESVSSLSSSKETTYYVSSQLPDNISILVDGDVTTTFTAGVEIKFGANVNDEYRVVSSTFDDIANSTTIVTDVPLSEVSGQKISLEVTGISEIYTGFGLTSTIITEADGEKVLVISASGGGTSDQSLNTTDSVKFSNLNIYDDTRHTETLVHRTGADGMEYFNFTAYPWQSSAWISAGGMSTVNNPYLEWVKQYSAGKTISIVVHNYGGSGYDFHINAVVQGNYDYGNSRQLTFDINASSFTSNDPSWLSGTLSNLGDLFYTNMYTWSYNVLGDSNYITFEESITIGTVYNPLTTTDNTVQIVDLIADTALIGDISIVGNNIAAVDSYGLSSDLNVSATSVIFDHDLNLSVDSVVSSTETVTDSMYQFVITSGQMGTPSFKNSHQQSTWDKASKFINGSVVSLTDTMYQTNIVIKLTSNFTYDMMDGWHATYTLISGNINSSEARNWTVHVTNSTGSVANYGFDDQGTLSTKALLIDGVAPSLLTNNIDGSKSVVVDTQVITVETVSDTMDQFRISNSSMGTALFKMQKMDSNWPLASKFINGSVVSLTDTMYHTTIVIKLTSNFTYDMSNYWHATYTLISGSIDGGSGNSSSHVQVTNTTGSVADYLFDDKGTLSTKALLVNGISPAFLTSNVDGSKSVVVDNSQTVTNTVTTTMKQPQWGYDMMTHKPYFRLGGAGEFNSLFKKGTVVTAWQDAAGQKGSAVTFTLTSDMAYNMNFGGYVSYTAESPPYNMSINLWDNHVNTSLTTGSVANYLFDDQGTLSVPTLLADGALIGDVSIVGNTISGVNSYGLASTLVVDGDLLVKNVTSSTANYTHGSPPSPGQWDGNISWGGSHLQWGQSDNQTITLIQSLKSGDKVTFEDSMNVGTYVTVTLTSAMTYDNMFMAYRGTVAENNPGMSKSASNNPITIDSSVTKTSAFNSTGLTVDGNLTVVGNLTLPSTVDTPVAPTTVVSWAKIVVGGQTYFTPLYQ